MVIGNNYKELNEMPLTFNYTRRVAKAIVNRREAQRLSQRELARRAKTTQAVISRIENGNVSVGLQMLQRIADALGTRIDIVLR